MGGIDFGRVKAELQGVKPSKWIGGIAAWLKPCPDKKLVYVEGASC